MVGLTPTKESSTHARNGLACSPSVPDWRKGGIHVRRILIGVGLVTTVAIAVAPAAMARPPYMAAFHKQYNITAESNIGKARCGACHTDGSKPAAGWTRFGKDLAVALGKRRAM